MLLAAALTLASAVSRAADHPVAGRKLSLHAHGVDPAARRATIVLDDAAITPPFPDFAAGGATLRLHGGVAPGQCYGAVDLDAAGWRPIDGHGERRGWRWRGTSRSRGGVRRVVVRPGRILVAARGANVPCGLEAAQREPVGVSLEASETRWCAAFGGEIAANGPGRFLARRAPPPPACPANRITVASLNILHGIFCPLDTVQCRFSERLDLFFQWIEDAGCPDVVTLQEVTNPQAPEILAKVPTLCGGVYAASYVGENFFDDEMHLARHPVILVEARRLLQQNFRRALFTRLDHPLGPLDVFSAHLAASGDGAQDPCAAGCPAECLAAGATNVRECQGVQMAAFVAARHDVSTPAVVTGDFNEPPGSFVWHQLVDRGWPDVYLATGLPECDPTTGLGCTAGRFDEDLTDLESPASGEVERIDYIFLVPPAAGACAIDPAFTRSFADEPNPFAATCGPAPDPLCWPSDHEGMQLGLDCR